MDSALVVLIGALGGTLLGFFLNEISAAIRHRGDDKRVLRRALFKLLELHHHSLPITAKPVVDVLHNWMKSQDPNAAGSITPEQLHQLLMSLIEPVAKPMKQEAIQSLAESYDEAVADIATIDPLLAYSLAGRSHAHSDMDRYFSSVESLYRRSETSLEDGAELSDVLSTVKEVLEGELSEALESEIRAVSKRISRWTRYRVSRYIERKHTDRMSDDMRKKALSMLDRFADSHKTQKNSG